MTFWNLVAIKSSQENYSKRIQHSLLGCGTKFSYKLYHFMFSEEISINLNLPLENFTHQRKSCLTMDTQDLGEQGL